MGWESLQCFDAVGWAAGRASGRYWKTQVRKMQVQNRAFRKDGKRMYGKRKYESAWVENASTENASTIQTFSQMKKVWYFTS